MEPHARTLGTEEPPPSQGWSTRSLVEDDPALQSRYEDYRRRQAAALLPLLPREGVRPLYRRAGEWARTAGVEVGKDPLALLLLFLEEILPLPPFHLWLQDRIRSLDAHVEEEFTSFQAARKPSLPVSVGSRRLTLDGRSWGATLHLFRRDGAWRAFISFRPQDGGEELRTGDVFREEDPEEIQSRFLSFHSQTLQAFLRSVLP